MCEGQERMVDYAGIDRTAMEGYVMTVSIGTHKDMKVWSRAMNLAESIYRLTATLPSDERYGLTSQMRRAAVSVPSNIAEGAARGSSAEFIRYLMIARGSLSELETQLILINRLKLTEVNEQIMDDIRIIRQMLIALARSLSQRKL
jgi:four helix bundle protein